MEDLKEKIEEKSAEDLVLENRRIIVKPIIRDRAFFRKGHDGQFMYTGCFKYYGLPVSLKTRTYLNPFKNKAEQYAFEELLGEKKGALNTTNRKSEFWGKEFKLTLNKEDYTLDLSDVNGALSFRVLSVDPKFCPIGGDRTIPEYQYELVDERYQEEGISSLALKKKKAYTELNKLAKSKQRMLDTLRLLEVIMSDTADSETLEGRLGMIIEQTEKFADGDRVKNIDDFLEIVKDPQATMRLFVLDAIDARELSTDSGEFRIVGSKKLIGNSLQEAVDWFSKIENQEQKLLIQERLKHS